MEEMAEELEEAVTLDQEAETPIERLDINLATLAQLEHLPGIGFITAQSIIAYRQANGPFTDTEDLKNVSGVEPETLAELEKHITVLQAPEEPETVEIGVEDHMKILEHGRGLLREGDVDIALQYYNQLIRQKQSLPSLIEDLQNALFNYPMNIGLYQSLGDAHMRNDQLQEALDVYTKAEELLR